MNSSNAIESPIESASAIELEPALSKTISRLSLLTAVVASQAYLIHASFFGHALTPIGVYVIDPKTHLHLLAGQTGNIEEVFHWDGVIPTILIAVLVFAFGWMAAQGTAKLLAGSRRGVSAGRSPDYQLSLVIALNDSQIVTNGGIV
jgi:hypothetical protein